MIDDTDYIIDQLEEEVKTLPEHKNQCIQHLIELGYIPLFKVNALLPKDVTQAKIDFFEDAKQSGLYTQNELTRHVFEEEEEFLADLLEKATDIDEGIKFDLLPEKGELSLKTRIIHYRLDIYGLWPFAINTPFNVVNSISALKTIGEYADCNELSALNYLGDAEELTRRLLEIHPEEDFILTFKTKNRIDKNLEQELSKTRRFRKQLLEDFGDRSDFFRFLRKEILKENARKVDFNFLNKEAVNPFKQFVLRLIQVHQWQDGIYQGLLDSDIGEVTIKSIITAVDLYNMADNKHIDTYRVLTHLVDNYFLFNGLFFLQEYMIEENETGRVKDAEDKIISDVIDDAGNSDDKRLNAFQMNMELLKMEIAITSKNAPEEKKGFLKRIYFGIKKFFQKVIKISKKIFGWVAHLVKKFWGILKKVFGHFFSKLSKGIKAFVDGLKFLLGRKGTTTKNEHGLIASVIRVDGDCYNFVAGDTTTILSEHNTNIKYNVSSMAFALTVVGGVLKIVMNAFSVFSWPMLIFSIVKIFKRVSESYKKIELITT